MITSRPMSALRLDAPGSPLALVQLPRPVAGPGEVLVRILAAGLNPLDTKLHAGQAAHAMKSTAHDLGAGALSDMCRTIELDCRRHAKLPADSQLTDLEAESALVVEELKLSLQAMRNGNWPDGE